MGPDSGASEGDGPGAPKQATAPALAPDLTEAYDRCLLTLDLMIDPDLGSMIVAPEFDPEYRRSGGYGYCWPRVRGGGVP